MPLVLGRGLVVTPGLRTCFVGLQTDLLRKLKRDFRACPRNSPYEVRVAHPLGLRCGCL